MYVLFVSYDCGGSYGLDCSSEYLDVLRPRMEELDEIGLRWCIEKDGEQIVDDIDCVCAIHKGIYAFMQKINGEDEK